MLICHMTLRIIYLFIPFSEFLNFWGVHAIKCPKNDIILSLEAINPLNNSYVPNSFYIRLGASVYSIEKFRERSEDIYYCWSFVDYEKCYLSIFDEEMVETSLSKAIGGNHELFAFKIKLVSRKYGNLCDFQLDLYCCINDSYFLQQRKQETEEKSYSYINWGKSIDYPSEFSGSSWHCSQTRNHRPKKFIIGLKSAALNFERRDLIRKTWLQSKFWGNTCLAFIIGNSSLSDIASTLLKEKEIFGDLLLGEIDEIPVPDSYHTLPIKFIEFLRWSNHFFSDQTSLPDFPFDYVVMSDDDVYINSTFLEEFVENAPRHRYYAGEVE